MDNKKANDPLTKQIIGCCFRAHKELGPGFPEKIYHRALIIAFNEDGLRFESEKAFEVKYQNKKVGNFKVDLLVENKVIVEIKSVSGCLPRIFEQQIISYLKASGVKVGLLVNFGDKSCQIKRFVY